MEMTNIVTESFLDLLLFGLISYMSSKYCSVTIFFFDCISFYGQTQILHRSLSDFYALYRTPVLRIDQDIFTKLFSWNFSCLLGNRKDKRPENRIAETSSGYKLLYKF